MTQAIPKWWNRLSLRSVLRMTGAIISLSACCALAGQPRVAVKSTQTAQTSPAETNQQTPASKFADEIAEARRLYASGKTAEAAQAYQGLSEEAKAAGDNYGTAEADFGMCTIAYRGGKYDAARSECEEAGSLFASLHDSLGGARVEEYFGNIAWQAGDNKTAKTHYLEALKVFEDRGLLKDKAELLITLAQATEGYPERIKIDTQALEIGRQLGDRRVQGMALHGIGQWLFSEGDAKAAQEKYKEAEVLLDSPEDQIRLARVLLSEGRLLRAHGEMDLAIATYGRALTMAEDAGDKQGSVQIMNAMGASYGDSGNHREALAIFQRGFDLAKDMNLPPMTDMLQQNIAESYINLGEYQRGADILEEMNRRDPDPFPWAEQFRYATLAQAYHSLGKDELALASVAKSVEQARIRKNEQFLSEPLMLRARIEEKLNQNEAALGDVHDALAVIEALRARLVPSDFMKRGFGDKTQDAFAFSVMLLNKLQKPQQALEVAEEARSRAFLDLLAARGIQGRTASPAAQIASAASAPTNGANPASPSSDALVTRGEHGGVIRNASVPGANLTSPISVSAPSFEQMTAIAKRLDSTVLSYWVGPDAIYIWVLKPDGTVKEARTEIPRDRLIKLVAGTLGSGQTPIDEKAPQPIPGNAASNTPVRNSRVVRLRGGGELIVGTTSTQPWRELYKLLILPVRDDLPAPGSRVTVVPYGPLFRLSFSALNDERGRYLVEDYSLNYTPALGLLQFTSAHKEVIKNLKPRYLVMADPQLSAGLLKDTALPRLPNARLEARTIERLFPAESVSVLTDQAATKEALQSQVSGRTVLHFATHAIVRDDQPFASFLALGEGAPNDDNGRLSVQDIYGLNMPADLVVLSACRTALGKLSGDGTVGLTRAFFYAGATSVIATLWDVADEPTYLLISEFYKNLKSGQDKGSALRAAQLHLLHELRAGRVKVKTPVGALKLPENPTFWAGFVLQGEY